MDRRRDEGLIVSGNTFPIKDEIKRLGGVWDRYEREWLVPDKKTAEALRGLMGGKDTRTPGQAAWDTYSSLPEGTSPVSQASKSKPASPKQVSYAMRLVGQLKESDFGTFTTFGLQGTTEKGLAKMSSSEISSMIDFLRDELFY
jgi:hypothetical protein